MKRGVGTIRFLQRLSILVVAIFFVMQPGYASDDVKKYEFDVNQETLSQSLDEFFAQTGIQLIYPHELGATKGMNPVKGRMTVDEALQLLLQGTALSGRLVEGEMIVISPKQKGETSPVVEEENVEKSSLKKGFWAAVSAFLFGVDGAAIAQDTQDDETEVTIETIVVTALKRERSVLDAPAGVSVIGGDDIERLSADSITDFIQLTPGISLGETARGNIQVQIRGVNSLSGASPIGFYLDDLPFSFINLNITPDPSPFDLESVEILRGPQGTLYGAGASAGVVVINTRDPNSDAFEAKLDTNISVTEGGDESYTLSAALNVPIIEDKLAVRGTVSYLNEGGWIDDSIDPNFTNINDRETFNGRLKLLATPTDKLSLLLSATVRRSDRDLTSDLADDRGRLPVSEFGFENFGLDVSSEQNYEQFGAVLEYEFPWFHMSNSISYIDYRNPNATLFILPVPTVFESESIVNEFRLTSNGTGPFSWVAGIFHRDAEQFIFQDASFVGLNFSPIDMGDSVQWSFFGDASLELLDGKLELSAGASYFIDDVSNEALLQPAVPDPIVSGIKTKLFSPQFSATLRPTEDVSIYARFAEGFRPGINEFAVSTFFAQASIPDIDGLVEAEKIDSFELGAKGQFFDKSLQAQFAVFWNNSDNVQQTATVTAPGTDITATTILNAGKARSRGAEISLNWFPTDSLDLFLNGSYVDAEIAEDFFSPGADPTTATPLFVEGDPIFLVPEYTAAAGGNYSWSIGNNGLMGTISANFQYVSERPLTSVNSPPVFGDEFLRGDLRAEVGRDNWSLYAFVENITDEDGIINPDPNSGVVAGATTVTGSLGLRTRPRTFGVGFRVDY